MVEIYQDIVVLKEKLKLQLTYQNVEQKMCGESVAYVIII